MAKNLKKGDKVEWNVTQGKTRGVVKKKVTSPVKIKSHKANASPEHPQFVVETENTKKIAVHKPQTLKKVK